MVDPRDKVVNALGRARGRLSGSRAWALARRLWRTPLPAAVGFSTLVFLFVYGLRSFGYLQSLELAAYDWQIRLRPPAVTPSRVTLLTITEKDISAAGRWPLPNATLAKLLQAVNRYHPRAIGVDMYLDVPVPPGRKELEQTLLADHDIIVGMKFGGGGSTGVPPPSVLQGTDQVGFTDMLVDPGGTVRRGLLFLDDGKNVYYSLALRVALLYLAAQGIGPQPDPVNPTYIRLGHVTIPPFGSDDGGYVGADAGGYQFLLDYRDRPGSFPVVTMGDFLKGKFDPSVFRNKVVLIGVVAQSVKDFFYTPYSEELHSIIMPGVELHAHIVSQLLRAALDGDPAIHTWSDTYESLWMLLWSVLAGLLALAIRSPWTFALAGVGGLAVLAASVFGAFLTSLWIPIVPPAMGWVLSGAVVMAYVQSREKRERASLMSLFTRHISRQLADDIWEHREDFLSGNRPRPQKLTATALFTDVQGFTTISESLDPPALMDWLNEYMETMTPIINEHGGVILRFVGDAIMAVFGVPIARTTDDEIRKDARNAVNCALAMERRLIEHNRRLGERGVPMIGMRIGILTGPMVAGSIGNAERVEYNVHGDTVNTASRLESYDKGSLTPDYLTRPCRVLIGEATYELVGDEFQTELVGEERLKGKDRLTRIYRVFGHQDARNLPEAGGEGGDRTIQTKETTTEAPAATDCVTADTFERTIEKKSSRRGA